MPSSRPSRSRPSKPPAAAERTSADDSAHHRTVVRRFVSKMVADRALVDDLTQETLARAHASSNQFRADASVTTWLSAIAYHVVSDHYRSAARKPMTDAGPEALEKLASDDDIEGAYLQAEMSSCIGEFVTRLPSPQSDVVALHDVAGLSHREVAVALDISVENSRVLLHRGRQALRHLFEAECRLSFGTDSVPCERR